MDFNMLDFRRYALKKDDGVKYKPSLRKKVTIVSKGTSFSIWTSYYIDNTAYLYLSKNDTEYALKLIKSNFTRFGFTVHCSDRRNDRN